MVSSTYLGMIEENSPVEKPNKTLPIIKHGKLHIIVIQLPNNPIEIAINRLLLLPMVINLPPDTAPNVIPRIRDDPIIASWKSASDPSFQ